MAKTIAKILGVVFILVGLLGFINHDLMGTHLSLTHNLVHLISGALALYFGFAGSLRGAKLFDIIFGVVYGLLGVAGFLLGHQGAPTGGVPGPPSGAHFAVLPGALELGTMDHVVHILLGILFLVGGLLTRVDVRD